MQHSSSRLILVSGMHRSGTSLLAHHLSRLGLHLPGDLVGAAPANPDGHFEASHVCRTHERLLINLGRWWPSAMGVLPLPSGWLESDPASAARASLLAWLQRQALRFPGPFVIKDPRLCLVLPLWRSLATELGWPLQVVINVRCPIQVAASLVKRDALIAGMSLQRAYQLWWQHYRSVLLDSADLPVLITGYDRWFDQHHRQVEALLAFCEHTMPDGCSLPQIRACQPSSLLEPLAQSVQELHASLASCCLLQQPELHGLRCWIESQPSSLPRTIHVSDPPMLERWTFKPLHHSSSLAEADLSDIHPWGSAALSLSAGAADPAAKLLFRWISDGLDERARASLLSRAPCAPTFAPSPDSRRVQLLVIGLMPDHWVVQCWLAVLGALLSFRVVFDAERLDKDQPRYALVLCSLFSQSSDISQLLDLSAFDCILDPSRSQASLLRALRTPAYFLDPACLPEPSFPPSSINLGLPSPHVLAKLGQRLLLGPLDYPSSFNGQSSLAFHLPDFTGLLANLGSKARLAFFAWLLACQRSGLRLIRLQPPSDELSSFVWSLFTEGPNVEIFLLPITAIELDAELSWRDSGQPLPNPCTSDTTPPLDACKFIIDNWSDRTTDSVSITVCVSLYNYEDVICRALDSVLAQDLNPLHLIVVDDASTDQSCERVQHWLQRHPSLFDRVVLVRHPSNCGLSATRNTAFSLAVTPWCFVLDADNTLDPSALSICDALAHDCDHKVAVIHPLIRTVSTSSMQMETFGLISALPWLAHAFVHGNYIDAMALIRTSAWASVGGFSHIPGGWEDYDFWCKLLDAGFTGQLCPMVCASYHRHPNSMLNSSTRYQLRRISRLLQARHPWLKLPYAQPTA